jgi:hypothetical protein
METTNGVRDYLMEWYKNLAKDMRKCSVLGMREVGVSGGNKVQVALACFEYAKQVNIPAS